MPLKVIEHNSPTQIFYYKGGYYTNGTEITLSEEYIKKHQVDGRRLWKYARYVRQVNRNGVTGYFFTRDKSDWFSLYKMGLEANVANDYAAYFVIDAWELDGAIEEITHPIKLSQDKTEEINKAIEDMIEHPKRDWDNPRLLILWIVYIAVMIGSLIFNQFYIIWAIASYLFIKLKRSMKDQ